MYEELVKRLRVEGEYADLVAYMHGIRPISPEDDAAKIASSWKELFAKAADAIEALMEVIQNYNFLESLIKPRWIPVTERLPDDRRDVQITVFWHDAWRTMYGYYDGAYWHLYAPMHTEVADVYVIGWMEKPTPMPEPPEEEE